VTLTVKVFFDDNTDKSERHKLISLKYCHKILFFNAFLQVLQKQEGVGGFFDLLKGTDDE
jgi:hypothetical protein